MAVSTWFNDFLSNIKLTDAQRSDARTKWRGITKCLNQHFYNSSSEESNSLLTGSWGKATMTRPPRDVDLLFCLPDSEKEGYSWNENKQSRILQKVKIVLQRSYPNTTIKGSGPVVEVLFTSYNVEVVPAFTVWGGQYEICITTGGGSFKGFDPKAEISNVSASDQNANGNTRNLIWMMKTWQRVCNVPLKSFFIELLAVGFLSTWQYRDKSSTYYDWMVRDYLAYIYNSYSVTVPGTGETIALGDAWKSRVQTAYNRALKAIEYEKDYPNLAIAEWQKIFGNDFTG